MRKWLRSLEIKWNSPSKKCLNLLLSTISGRPENGSEVDSGVDASSVNNSQVSLSSSENNSGRSSKVISAREIHTIMFANKKRLNQRKKSDSFVVGKVSLYCTYDKMPWKRKKVLSTNWKNLSQKIPGSHPWETKSCLLLGVKIGIGN